MLLPVAVKSPVILLFVLTGGVYYMLPGSGFCGQKPKAITLHGTKIAGVITEVVNHISHQ